MYKLTFYDMLVLERGVTITVKNDDELYQAPIHSMHFTYGVKVPSAVKEGYWVAVFPYELGHEMMQSHIIAEHEESDFGVCFSGEGYTVSSLVILLGNDEKNESVKLRDLYLWEEYLEDLVTKS